MESYSNLSTVYKGLILLVGIVFSSYLFSQESENFPPPETAPAIYAQEATGEIKIDGKLTEASWQVAQVTTDFFRMEPRQGGSYLYDTEVKILFDEKNLYVGAFCKDSVGKKGIRAQDLRRDFSWGNNDIFSIQLDPQNLKQYCVSFQTTPYGNQRDMQNFNDEIFDNDWNALWSVRTHQTDSGYYAEFAIPFKSLRYDRSEEAKNVSWGVTFQRLARRDYEQTVFPAIPQSFTAYRMTYAAELRGLNLPEPSANVRIEPYTLYQYDNVEEGNNSMSTGEVKLGGDLKWAINPRTVVDLTINTDFAQADVDRAVNNLERFNIFFPERRQFFLENSGIWAGSQQTAIRPFFSRAIGLQGEFNAEPAPIHTGIRFTQRDEDKAIAGMYVRQGETGNSPASNFSVMRYLNNYGRENNVGVMLTHRQDGDKEDLGIKSQNNSTITVDGLIRPKSIWSIRYLLSTSIDYEEGENGFAGSLFAGRSANNSYMGWVTEVISPNYNPAMGFVRQKNVIRHNPGGYYIWRPKGLPWIRRFDPGAFFDFYHDADKPGQFQQAEIYIFPIYLFFTDGSFFQYALFPNWQNINFDFSPLGIPIAQDDYYYMRHQVNFYTDRSAKFSLSGSVNWGKFYNGDRVTLSGGIRFAPSVHAAITLDHEYNDLKGLGLEEQNLITNLTTVGARFAVNPRLQLSTFYQYNSFDQQGRWNIRASWEYQPLSFIYVVFNDTQINGLDTPFQEQQLIGKVTFVKQF
ncbi:MAG: DUF5916 domain-containing protein [Bacteroidota bacterium]